MNPWFRQLLVILLFGTALGGVLLPGCKPREEVLASSGALEFSADTVKFDTVFTTLRTVTKRLWVYNRNSKAVNIDLINLDNASSPYTLIINGDLLETARNVYVRGQDSLLILVRAKLPDNGTNASPKQFVVQELLHFTTNGNAQQVLLRSFGQNIVLHQDVNLTCNEVWTNERPHVLYGTVVVPTGCTLTIRPGTRIYAHAGATLVVDGSLRVNEPADFAPTDTVKAGNRNLVRFSGDRLEPEYATAPGQWTGIVLDAGSHNNLIRYAQVQNAAVGVLLANLNDSGNRPDLQVENCVIRYMSGNSNTFAGALSPLRGLPGAGIFNIGGDVTVENTLFSDCYEYALLNVGGSAALNFCTIANYPALPGPRKTQSLTMTNQLEVSDNTGTHTVTYTQPELAVSNSIVWGSTNEEIFLDNADAYRSSIQVQHSLLRTKAYKAATDSTTKPGLGNPAFGNILNQDPLFVRPATGSTLDDYRLIEKSPAWHPFGPIGAVPLADLLNLPRDQAKPNLGAYEGTK